MQTPPAGYQWDDSQNARCQFEWGFSFHDVVEVFRDPGADHLVVGPVLHGPEGLQEERFLAVGRMEWGSVVTVVYTMRGTDRRLIWVRPARREEREAFYQHNGIRS
jgi:uncharacterized DUF497 family protein